MKLSIVWCLRIHNTKWLKNLLTHGAAYQIYFVIGSTLPYRNLLLQLMQPGNKRNSPVNEIYRLQVPAKYNKTAGGYYYDEISSIAKACAVDL